MNSIADDSPIASELSNAITEGDTDQLKQLLAQHPGLASCQFEDKEGSLGGSPLHEATNWPGHFPNVARSIQILCEAGADPNVGVSGPGTETPLHWAPSSNDVDAIIALLKAGANINANGAVIAGGDPLENAIGFQNWAAAACLVEHGAVTELGDEAALGLLKRIERQFSTNTKPSAASINYSFWNACCAGQLATAMFLFHEGANLNWIPDWCEESPLDGAVKSGNFELISWLNSIGAVHNKK